MMVIVLVRCLNQFDLFCLTLISVSGQKNILNSSSVFPEVLFKWVSQSHSGSEPIHSDPTPPNEPEPSMPQPGVQLHRRSKGPELVRDMLSQPLEPPSEPKGIVEATSEVINPHQQLQLVDIWLLCAFCFFRDSTTSTHVFEQSPICTEIGIIPGFQL